MVDDDRVRWDDHAGRAEINVAHPCLADTAYHLPADQLRARGPEVHLKGAFTHGAVGGLKVALLEDLGRSERDHAQPFQCDTPTASPGEAPKVAEDGPGE
jgi:hypothetical protein